LRRVGIFGATFDPPHFGHLIAGQSMMEALNLDLILMLPANINPLKEAASPAPVKSRLRMITEAVASNSKFNVCDIEIKRGGTSYMIDTVIALRQQYPDEDTELYLLIGADTAEDFHLWKEYQRLSEMVKVVVFNRPGYNLEEVIAKMPVPVLKVLIPMIEISSTMIRERVLNGESIRYLVPEAVRRIIKEEKLYQ
jgi:nicotinate-nucleotide adenylyltransferase